MQSLSSWNALGQRIGNLTASLLRPFSRGSVQLDPAAPDGAPRVEFNFLHDERDLARMRSVFVKAVDIVHDAHVRPLVHSAFAVRFGNRLRQLNECSPANARKAAVAAAAMDLFPGLGRPALRWLTGSRAELDELASDPSALSTYVSENVAGSFHPAGTCRMGHASDPLAVVDPCGRVHGLANIRIADASIMPTVPAGNTFLPTVMIAEKIASDMSKTSLPQPAPLSASGRQ